LHAGEDWQNVIEKTIEESDFVIICLSSQAMTKKGFVQREIRKTLEVVEMQPEDTVYLIPVRLDACEIPRSIARFHAVNLFESEGFARLEESIRYAWRQSRAKQILKTRVASADTPRS
jgi:predicted chitinase